MNENNMSPVQRLCYRYGVKPTESRFDVMLPKVMELAWIPCSERLPDDEKGRYWVCTDTEYQCECRWTNINHIWTDLTTEWHWHIVDVPQYSKVIAWMPLPEPYKGGDADDD